MVSNRDSLYSPMRNSNETTIGKRHSALFTSSVPATYHQPFEASNLKIEISKCVEITDLKVFGALPDAIIARPSYHEVRNAPIVAPESAIVIDDFIRDGYHYQATLENLDEIEISFDLAAKSPQIPLLGEFTLVELIEINMKLPLLRVFMVNRELKLEIHSIFNQQIIEPLESKPCFLRKESNSCILNAVYFYCSQLG